MEKAPARSSGCGTQAVFRCYRRGDMISKLIKELTDYALAKGLIEEADRVWAVNGLLQVMEEESYEEPAEAAKPRELAEILEDLIALAIERGLCEDSQEARDLFDTKLMGVLTPPPSQVIRTFLANEKE